MSTVGTIRILVAFAVALVLTSCAGGGGVGTAGLSGVPEAPTITRASPGPTGSGQTTLYWTISPGATSYNLSYAAGSSVTGSDTVVIASVTSPHTVSGLVEGTPYAFVITAVGDEGESQPSATFNQELPYYGSDVPNFPLPGSDAANIDDDVPAWIRTSFRNVRAFRDGDSIVIETRGLPPYKSYYYGSTGEYAPLHESIEPDYADPNFIEEHVIAMTVPLHPAITSTTSASGYGLVGIARNGVPIFNADAEAPDSIADEVFSFDTRGGHPQEADIYHYHTEPAAFQTMAGDELVGVALDGFPIFGLRSSRGQVVFNAGGNASEATPSSQWSTDSTNWVAASYDPALSLLPHYHVVDNYYQDTVDYRTGTPVELQYMIGSYLAGTPGTVTNFGATVGSKK